MRWKDQFVIYLSGPMTGYVAFNRPMFDKVAAELREMDYFVIVPGEGETYDSVELAAQKVGRKKIEFYLSRDIDYIQEMADAVVVLPGWEDSAGAKLEVAVAQALGIPCFWRSGKILKSRVTMDVALD